MKNHIFLMHVTNALLCLPARDPPLIVECKLCGAPWTVSSCDVPLVSKGLGKERSGVRRPCGASQSGVLRSLTAAQQRVLQKHVSEAILTFIMRHGEERVSEGIRAFIRQQDRMGLPHTRAGKDATHGVSAQATLDGEGSLDMDVLD